MCGDHGRPAYQVVMETYINEGAHGIQHVKRNE